MWLISAAVLIYLGKYNFGFFTYWDYTVFGTFLCFVFTASAFNSPKLTLFNCTIFHPIAQGTPILVLITIGIIVKHSLFLVDELFKDRPITSSLLANIRDGDWIVHGFTVVGVLYVSSSFHNIYVSKCMRMFLDSHSIFVNTLVIIWWFISPLLLISIYTLSGNWAPDQYPTDISPTVAFITVVLISLAIQTQSFISVFIQIDNADFPDDIILTGTYFPRFESKLIHHPPRTTRIRFV